MMALRTLSRPVAQTLRTASAPASVRTVTTLGKSMYTAKAESYGGGRNGGAKLREGSPLKFDMAMPTALGGTGKGQNPEQFFGTPA